MGRLTSRQRITLGLMAACAVLLIAWDVFVANDGVPGNTISELTLAWALVNPFRPFAAGLVLGVVLGHLFWPQGK